jgi:uncharacterized radical SAM superfamily Fe-S cluster-containing enzyme
LPILKNTTSVCSTCLTKVPAEVVAAGDDVVLRKECPEHGFQDGLIASDQRLHFTAGSGAACPDGCGGLLNHSCTLIFEITERCNLSCPTCFAGSSPHLTWQMSLEDFTEKLDRLLARGKHESDMVQLSGGEPTVHPDIEQMVEICFARGVRKIYINTNGIRLAKEPEFAGRLAAIDSGRDALQFYLQFDGLDERTHEAIRGARGLFALKELAIANATAAGLFVLPVMTVTRGINLDQIGDVVRFVLRHHPQMNTLMLQPAFYAGRYDTERQGRRLTLAELAHEVERQTDRLFSTGDFGPIPCSHPNCFGLAVGLVQGDGTVQPISRYFPRFERWEDPQVAPFIARMTDQMPQHMLESMAEDESLDALLDLLSQDDEQANWADYRKFFMIGIKPFMDAETYNQDRVDRCCVHVVDREGVPVSLCEYNTLRRPRGLV